MTDAPGAAAPDPEQWEELEPQREWTSAERWRLTTWALIAANILGVLLLAPVGDGGIAQAADAVGIDDGPARLTYWIILLTSTFMGNGVGAGAAATKQRWAIVPVLLATAGCWIGFAVAQAMV